MQHIIQPLKLSLLAILLIGAERAGAQTIVGHVTNEQKQPISGATISLCKYTDSTIVASAKAESTGHYSINNSTAGSMLLKAAAKDRITEWKKVTSATQQINFTLKENKTLAEVTVSSNVPLVERKSDRTVFNIENSVAANAGDAYLALKKTPGVQIMQSQILIEGKGGVSVMINGRLQQVAGDDLVQLLRSIPSSNLAKIEVINAPGAKYDAEGSTGIINLLTKKNLNMGLRGTVSAGLTRNMYYSPSGSASLQYRNGKLNLFSNNSINQWNWLYTGITMVYFDGRRIHQENNTKYSTTNGRLHLGGDYALTHKTTLGFSFAEGFGGSDYKDNVRSVTYTELWIPDSVTYTNGKTYDAYKNRHTANLNYEWRIDSLGKKLNVDGDYFEQTTDRERNFRVNNYYGAETSPYNYKDNRITSTTSVVIRTIKADLELPYPTIRLTMGAKASFVNNDGQFKYLTKEVDGYVPDSGRTNRFLFDEEIQAVYISGKKKFDKLDVQVGVRAERTYNLGYTPATRQTFVRDYTNLFPSLNAQYKINDDHSLAFNYNRRINRPGYNLLNPFRFYLNETYYSEGNAGLTPSFNNAADITWFFLQQYNIRFRASYINDYWDRLFITDSAAGTTSLTRANVGNAAFYGITFNYSKTINKWWDVQGFAGLEYSWFKLRAYGADRFFHGCNAFVDVSNTFYLNKQKTIVAELHMHYYTPRTKDYKKWEEMSLVDGGVKAMLMDKNLILGFSFEDPFKKAYWDQKNQVNGTEEFSYDNAALANFTVTYKFGNNNLKSKRERSEANEEIQRAK